MKRCAAILITSLALIGFLTGTAFCQGDDMGLGDLLGGMGGMGGLGLLGGLGGLSASALGAGGAAAPSVVISQPAMLISGDNLYIACNGKVIRFNALTLEKKAEAWYEEPQTQLIPTGTGTGPSLIAPAPGGAVPPLVPGATPSTGP
ncbi:MAG: hypothetical protein HPY44_11985 [Armatimonadetes bacterium]|nr:hypothetical protein [Armatimonadota bacterium]